MRPTALLTGESALGSGASRAVRVWSLALLMLMGGAALRFVNIGQFGFWTDEMFHVFAAKSLLQTGKMNVPMTGEYERAKPVTMVTAAAFRFLGESEATARAPFVLINLAFLLGSFLIVRRLFSDGTALIYLALMTFAPLSVEFAREARMYAAHQLVYFLAASAFLVGFEDLVRRPLGAASSLKRVDPQWLVTSVLLFVAGLTLHELTYNLAITVAFYVVSMFLMVWVRAGWQRAFASKYAVALAAGAVMSAAIVWFFPAFLWDRLNDAVTLFDWQAAKRYDASFYRYFFMDNFPALVFLYPVGAYVLVRRFGQRGLFAVLGFLPLILMHSFVFARKSDRYVFYIFPFFVLAAAAALEPLVDWAVGAYRLHFGNRILRVKILALLLFSPVILLIAHPWLQKSVRVPFTARYPDWKSVDRTFRASVASGRVVTTNPREFVYYFHRFPDYYRCVDLAPEGLRAPGLIEGGEAFHRAVTKNRDVYFIGAEWNFHNDAFMDSGMRSSVLFNMSAVDHGGDRRILAYHRN